MSGTNHKYAFLDTNTLMHFRPLEEVNWREVLEAETVTIILVPVVFRELDRHKDMHPVKKLRHRVRALISKLSKMLDQGTEHKLREAVTLRFEAREPTLDFGQHRLRPDQNDDQLVASILQFRLDQPGAQVVLVTADLGLKIKARHHQMEVRSLSDTLKIPEEPDEDQKSIRELQAKLASYENRLPKLRVAFSDDSDRLVIIRNYVPPLSMAAIQEEVDEERRALALNTGLDSAHILTPLSPAAERKYQGLLEEYFLSYESYVRDRQEAKAARARTISLTIQLLNDGRAPGDDLDVFLIFPPELAVQDEDPSPPEPEKPKPPKRPKGGIFEMIELSHLLTEQGRLISSIPLISPATLARPNVSSPHLTKTPEGFEVRFHVQRAKQKQIQLFDTLFVPFPAQDALKSFQIGYIIQAANLPDEIEGTLHVVVKDS